MDMNYNSYNLIFFTLITLTNTSCAALDPLFVVPPIFVFQSYHQKSYGPVRRGPYIMPKSTLYFIYPQYFQMFPILFIYPQYFQMFPMLYISTCFYPLQHKVDTKNKNKKQLLAISLLSMMLWILYTMSSRHKKGVIEFAFLPMFFYLSATSIH